jgi:DNA-binding phage protein
MVMYLNACLEEAGFVNKQHIGSSLDAFLAEDSCLKEATATALKRVIALRLADLPGFDMADHLPDEQAIAEYLAIVQEENDPAALAEAQETVARARGGKVW